MKKVGLCLMVFTLPTIIGITYPTIFIKALGYAGGFSCAILFGLFPPLMVWIGRYVKGYDHTRKQLFGGKAMLSLLMLFVFVELILEIRHLIF
jgi:tyrosine-specific transport protein